MYSVISVNIISLQGNTQNRESTPSWRLFYHSPAQEWTTKRHEKVDCPLFTIAGSQLSFTEITEYIYFF